MAKRRKPEKLNKWIYSLWLLRILLVIVPQTGYIHPDEYFQSVEVLAGKVFDVEHSPPWEFNTTLPIRGPVGILSIFPHQEPRFLIPILFPLIYLHSDQILPESDRILVKTPEGSIQNKTQEFKAKTSSNQILKIWLSVNFLFLIFYGFIHQGGVYLAVNYMHKDIKFTPMNTEFHIVTSNIYSLPESFLLQKTSNKLFSQNQIKYSVKKRVFLYEEGSKDLTSIISDLESMVNAKKLLNNSFKHYKKYKIYLLISSSRSEQAENILMENGIFFSKLDSFWPHISTEAFPDLTKYCINSVSVFYKNCEALPLRDYIRKINEMCELILYELDYQVKKPVMTRSM
ncbi:unnamed protein product [Ceutorhynchus assimilis]|uniref:Mannosyltransferase n=1 Tax=Ceutorhynchus assimilis TaxID=467358 RepID=A0A9P0GM02_9CUCU|nr:unnamed protein product [Ceutorhynchus assimilis]